VRLDQVPVDGVAEEQVDVLLAGVFDRPVEREVLPFSDAWLELSPAQMRHREDRLRLPLHVGMRGRRLQRQGVLEQPSIAVTRMPRSWQ
jgi:hypothetical protein